MKKVNPRSQDRSSYSPHCTVHCTVHWGAGATGGRSHWGRSPLGGASLLASGAERSEAGVRNYGSPRICQLLILRSSQALPILVLQISQDFYQDFYQDFDFDLILIWIWFDFGWIWLGFDLDFGPLQPSQLVLGGSKWDSQELPRKSYQSYKSYKSYKVHNRV